MCYSSERARDSATANPGTASADIVIVASVSRIAGYLLGSSVPIGGINSTCTMIFRRSIHSELERSVLQ